MIRVNSIVAAFLILLPLSIYAQGEEGTEDIFKTVGTSAAQFLNVGVGARALAMGGAFGAFANDATALYWNPAGIATLKSAEFVAAHTQWIADISHDFVGLVFPLASGNFIGLSAVFQNTDEIEVTTIREPRGTGETYDVSDIAVGLSYARAMTDFINVGITAKIIQQKVWHETARTIGVDIGTMLNTGIRGIYLAMVMTNYGGGLKLDGRDLIRPYDQVQESIANPDVEASLRTETWPLPTDFRASIRLDVIGGNQAFLTSSGSRLTGVIDLTHPSDHPEYWNVGTEYSLNDLLFLRAGYRGSSVEIEEGLTLGGGLRVGLGAGMDVLVDYAYADFGVFSNVQHFTLRFTF